MDQLFGIPTETILELKLQLDKADLCYMPYIVRGLFEPEGPDSLSYMLKERNRHIAELEEKLERIEMIIGG